MNKIYSSRGKATEPNSGCIVRIDSREHAVKFNVEFEKKENKDDSEDFSLKN